VTSSQRDLHPQVCAHAGRTKQKARPVTDRIGLDQAHGRLSVGCVDGGENLDLPTRAAKMSLQRVMRAKISRGRNLIVGLQNFGVNSGSSHHLDLEHRVSHRFWAT